MDSELFELLMSAFEMFCPSSYDRYPNAREIGRESKKYSKVREKFQQQLSSELKDEFEECLETGFMWQATCERGAFVLGYQTGVRLLLAALKEEPA